MSRGSTERQEGTGPRRHRPAALFLGMAMYVGYVPLLALIAALGAFDGDATMGDLAVLLALAPLAVAAFVTAFAFGRFGAPAALLLWWALGVIAMVVTWFLVPGPGTEMDALVAGLWLLTVFWWWYLYGTVAVVLGAAAGEILYRLRAALRARKMRGSEASADEEANS